MARATEGPALLREPALLLFVHPFGLVTRTGQGVSHTVDNKGVSDGTLLALLLKSEPVAVIAAGVFLALTLPRQRGNRRSGRSRGTGRDRAPNRSEPED